MNACTNVDLLSHKKGTCIEKLFHFIVEGLPRVC